ncbi:MAG: SRPBCC family protein [Flavobacteriaceae bacterium]|nr:SRPBCC family protein [Flavobacteriaceae bacterium]
MIFVYILTIIIAVLVILNSAAPKRFDLNRSIEINAPVSTVYNYLKYIKNQDDWSPWKRKDPDMKQEFEGTDGEIGFISRWKGNKEVGEGEQELKHLVENESILSELRFFKPWNSQSDAYFQIKGLSENSTRVIWGFSGKNKFPFNILMLFFNMEKSVGKDFEEGLSSLKSILENK